MTDLELKKFLAEQLPEMIEVIPSDITPDKYFFWRTFGIYKNTRVKDTEWLHITRLVEEKLTKEQCQEYSLLLQKLVVPLGSLFPPFKEPFAKNYMWHASWQPRATALKQVLSINEDKDRKGRK